MRSLRELVWARCMASTLPEIVGQLPSDSVLPPDGADVERYRWGWEKCAMVAAELADAAVLEFDRRFPITPRPPPRIEAAPTLPDVEHTQNGRALCTAITHRGPYSFVCTLGHGHRGTHKAIGPEGKLRARWDDAGTELPPSTPVPPGEVEVHP